MTSKEALDIPSQRTADDILKLCRGFQPASVVIAAAELDVFSALAAGAADAAAVAEKIGADVRGTTVLLDALAALGMLEKRDAAYHPAAGAADLLTEDSPDNILGIVRHLGSCQRRWARLAESVKTGRPVDAAAGVRGREGDLESFIRAMDDVSRPVAAEVIAALEPIEFDHLLDAGGGPGTWTIAFLAAHPDARATLFDLPAVIPMAEANIAAAGLTDRVELVGGDLSVDDLPPGADLVWFGAVLHMNSREQNRALLAKAHAALVDGGQVVIRDLVMDPSRTEPPAGALFAVNMLVATAGGGTYTLAEYSEDLIAAGFAEPALVHQAEMSSLVRAVRKPAD